METNNKSLQILQPQNMEIIAANGPQIVEANRTSHTRCVNAGKAILMQYQLDGMSDDLDAVMASYITKAKKTVVKMRDTRAPITKIFDDIRSEFTAMESAVNPSTQNSIPFQIQQIRNQWAAHKLAEEQRRRQAEVERIARQQAKEAFAVAVEQFYRQLLNQRIDTQTELMTKLFESLSANPDNSAIIQDGLTGIPDALPNGWIDSLTPSTPAPANITESEAHNIIADVRNRIAPQLIEQYRMEVGDTKRSYIEQLPGKISSLKHIAQLQAEDAARAKAVLQAKEQQEAEARAKAKAEAEAKAKAEVEAKQKAAEMDALFGTAQVTAATAPVKAQVKKVINVLNPEGFMDIIGLWWSQKGCTMTVEELSKEFKKQITFCEKLANDKANPIEIKSEHVEYVEDIKAK